MHAIAGKRRFKRKKSQLDNIPKYFGFKEISLLKRSRLLSSFIESKNIRG
jgi:hypothetical protein